MQSNQMPPRISNLEDFLSQLEDNECLEGSTVDLSYQSIRVEGARYIANALKHPNCPAKLTVNLYRNFIGDEGAKIIADALAQGPRYLTLNLGQNEIGNDGAIAIAIALQNCAHGLKLDLRHNRLNHTVSQALADALKSNRTAVLELQINDYKMYPNECTVEQHNTLQQYCSRNQLIENYLDRYKDQPDHLWYVKKIVQGADINTPTQVPSLKMLTATFFTVNKDKINEEAIDTARSVSELKEYFDELDTIRNTFAQRS